MQITPEWVAALAAAATVGGGFGAWIERRRQRARDAMPIFRVEWTSGTGGHGAKVTIINRLNEDLIVTAAEVKSRLVEDKGHYDTAKAAYVSNLVPTERKQQLAWHILANAEATMQLGIEHLATPRWLRLTISSSAGTMRARKFVMRG